jgi:hypothetical protein
MAALSTGEQMILVELLHKVACARPAAAFGFWLNEGVAAAAGG